MSASEREKNILFCDECLEDIEMAICIALDQDESPSEAGIRLCLSCLGKASSMLYDKTQAASLSITKESNQRRTL